MPLPVVRRAGALPDKLKGLWRSRITAGVVASYANTGVGMVTNFVAIPIYLKYLGREEYGLWMTISGVVLYLGFLNFGITQATENHFGAAVVRQNREEQSRVLSTGFWWYLSIVSGAILIVAAVEPLLPLQALIKGADGLVATTRRVFLVTSACYLLELPFRIFPGCLRNIGKIDVQQWLGAAQALAKVIVAFGYLALGGSIVGLIVAISVTNIAFYAASYVIMRRELPHLSLGVRHFDSSLRKDMAGPSFFFFLLQVSGAICVSTDAVVISSKLGTEQVTPYSIAQRIGTLAIALVTTISTNFGPSFLRAYSKGALTELSALFKRAMLISIGVGSALTAVLLLAGPWFIPFWVGDKNYVGFLPYLLIMAFVLMQMVLNPCDRLLTITGNHRTYAVFAFIEALVNLGLSIALVDRFGVAGVVMGTLVARVFIAAPVMLWQSWRLLRGPVGRPADLAVRTV